MAPSASCYHALAVDRPAAARGRPIYAPLVRYRSVQYHAAQLDRLRRVIAYDLGNLLRRLALPLTIGSWSLTSCRNYSS